MKRSEGFKRFEACENKDLQAHMLEKAPEDAAEAKKEAEKQSRAETMAKRKAEAKARQVSFPVPGPKMPEGPQVHRLTCYYFQNCYK